MYNIFTGKTICKSGEIKYYVDALNFMFDRRNKELKETHLARKALKTPETLKAYEDALSEWQLLEDIICAHNQYYLIENCPYI